MWEDTGIVTKLSRPTRPEENEGTSGTDSITGLGPLDYTDSSDPSVPSEVSEQGVLLPGPSFPISVVRMKANFVASRSLSNSRSDENEGGGESAGKESPVSYQAGQASA